jgi:histidinol-phosphatase
MTEPLFGPAWSASRARVPETTLRDWLAFAQDACDVADVMAMEHFRRDLDLERKPDRSFVTIADQGIEREIRGRIEARYPGHGLVGEEYGTVAGDAPTRWYIDPIDGTHNYIRGVPLFGTLLAAEHEGEIQVGVISAPAMRQRWFAWRGGGSWHRDIDGAVRRIRVSRVAAIDDAQILYGSRRENVSSGVMPGFDALIEATWRARGFGDFWGYTLLAEGCAEAMLETLMKPWDLAAPQIVIEEAGGRVTDAFGERRIDATSFVATNGVLHDEVLRRLNP